jgi:bifunctional DNA-binding transcriptional regulator/antitoxin component of YhaV-PrlF toxin-antitoxin module
MQLTDKQVILRVQTGGRLTIPSKYATENRIEDGALVIVSIEKAVIRSADEMKGD